ncbi:hypothetical protein [Salimicrobium halophilum]|uniref:Apea-like HEPN domain-containing protein n=1 Tax=Salimicrobium halophilum TaxID=86666 RepID=A0A1G8W564_9BACI|nr:hypothetical protein [Salimicrobium halophilum]SDJ73461.1 hypothetical protein SAMN04490247_3033 [Salimicrobium halophilum]
MEKIDPKLWGNVVGLTNSQKFFIEAWIELTDFNTNESYRPRVMNLKKILNELYTYLSGVLEGQDRFKIYVEEITNEALEILEKEKILLENEPVLLLELQDVLRKLKGIKNRKSSEVYKAREQLVILKKIIYKLEPQYREKLISRLKETINEGNNNRLVLQLTSMFLTDLIADGHSMKHLYFCKRALIEWKEVRPDSDFESRFTRMLENLESEKQWTVYFKIYSNEPFDIEFPNYGMVKFYNALRFFGAQQDLTVPDDFTEETPEVRYASVKVTATNPHGATLIGRDIIENLLDTIVYTIVNQHLEIYHKVFIPNDGGLNESSLRQLHQVNTNTRFSFEEIISFFENVENSNFNNESIERLKAALRFYRMSITTNTEHVAFINSWTSIEYLITGNNSNINQDDVRNIISTILSLRYVTDLINDLKLNLFNLEIKHPYGECWEEIDESEFIKNLRDSEFKDELSETLEDNELLKHRTMELAENISSNEKMLAHIEKHKQRIEWHISRLYRTRNVIAHEASDVDVTLILPHIQLYNFLIIETALNFISEKNMFTSLDEVFIKVQSWYSIATSYVKDNEDYNPIVKYYEGLF